MHSSAVVFKYLPDLQPYESIWLQMRSYTHSRAPERPLNNEIWFLEHAPVYTQGQAGKPEHVLCPDPTIPIVQSDRGGQITYHGPGQLMVYLLLNLKQFGFDARTYVQYLEQAIIDVLAQYPIPAFTQPNAPGVYVCLPNQPHSIKKIASIGIRVRKNFSYHGICLNVSGDLKAFNHINPCGYSGLGMAQLSDFEQTKNLSLKKIIDDLQHYFKTTLEVRTYVR